MRLRFAARLALVNSILIAAACIVLSSVLVRNGLAGLARSLADRGRATVASIAREAELSMLSGNVDGLREIGMRARTQPAILYVRFEDARGTFVEVGEWIPPAMIGPAPAPSEETGPPDGVTAWEFRALVETRTIPAQREEMLAEPLPHVEPAREDIGTVVMRMELSSLRRGGRRMVVAAAVLTTIVALIAVVIAVVLAKATTRHLATLARAADRIALGQLNTRVTIPTHDEIAALAESFNAMAHSLAQSRAAVDEHQRTLEDKVEARTERLAAMNRELAEANRLKSEFMATVSHELRTPLNVILGYTEVLGDGMAGDVTDAQRELLGSIAHYSRLQLDLITNVLDFERLSSGRITTHVERFDLRTVLDDIRRLHNDRKPAPVQLHVEVAPDFPLLETDRVKVLEVLRNLVDNAVKFTERGGIRIDCRTAGRSGWVTIAVTDTGIGISPEELTTIFDEFRQVGDHYTRRTGGVGLGLAITKRLVAVLGGTIEAESRLGERTTFRVSIPAALPSEAHAAA